MDPTIAPGQKRMQRAADQGLMNLCKTFNEIMTGPNPLTKEEIRTLVEKYPERYSILERWAR